MGSGVRTTVDPSAAPERALLVSVDLGQRKTAVLTAARQARKAATLRGVDELEPEEPVAPIPTATADERFLSGVEEFRELVLSAGAQIAGELTQRRARADAATLIGSGKVQEVAAVAQSSGANVIIFGQNLTPTRLRNLERALPVRVIDRTQLILDIFARHARTREGMLQVELAQLEYMLPRLTGRGRAMSRLGGGIGTRGPGETQLETDRRRIQRRISQLKGELESVRRIRGQQRQRREAVPVPTVALVGYTNAGKSTLFNALTGAGVAASARMFATLDPKLRAISLPSRRKILLSDTVGFIRDLPPTLISSFRATLEEVQKAEVLLHVQDCSSPMREENRSEVKRVLAELGVQDKPQMEVLNKADLLPPEEQTGLRRSVGRPLVISAKTGAGLEDVLERLDVVLEEDPMMEARFRIPQAEGEVIASLEAGAVIRGREYDGNLVRMEVSAPQSLVGRFRKYLEK